MADFGDQSDTLDIGQIFRSIFVKSKDLIRVEAHNALVPEDYDEIQLAYITSGNGTGEIGTVFYLKETTLQATLSLTYDSQCRITGVKKV